MAGASSFWSSSNRSPAGFARARQSFNYNPLNLTGGSGDNTPVSRQNLNSFGDLGDPILNRSFMLQEPQGMLSGDFSLAATDEFGNANFFHHTYAVASSRGLFRCQTSEDQAPLINFPLGAAAATDSTVDVRSWEDTAGVCTAQLLSAQPYGAHTAESQHVRTAGLSIQPLARNPETFPIPTGTKLSHSPKDGTRSSLSAGQQPRSLQGQPALSAIDDHTERSTDERCAERDSVGTPKKRTRRFGTPCQSCVRGGLPCRGLDGRRDLCLQCSQNPKVTCDRPEILRKGRRQSDNRWARKRRAEQREERKRGKANEGMQGTV